MALQADDKIAEVRERANLAEIAGEHVRLKRAGRNLVGLCPFHQEKTPSFSVNPERGFFHCFGCGAGGSVFDFVMRIEGGTFFEALQSLARRYGIALPRRGSAGGGAGERDALVLVNQTAADFYLHVLWKTPEGALAREYLQARGIAHETARAFMIGYAPARPANLANALDHRGLLGPAAQLGLVRKDASGATYDMFRARLMFPIRDAQGRVIAFGGRVLDQRLPKYINSPESALYSKARAVYGIHEARGAITRSDRAIVVEGYIDAIALWQAGFQETVASLGTALTVDQLRLLGRYTKNLVACFDGDAAGRKASLRALEVFLAAGLLGRGIFVPAGLDPDTLIRQRGANAFAELLEKSELLVDYFLREQVEAARGSLGGRVHAAERVAEILRMVANPFEFDLLARKAASLIGVDEKLLRRQAREPRAHAGRPPANAATAAPERADTAAQAELGLLAIALSWPGLRREIFDQLERAQLRETGLSTVLREVCTAADPAAALEQPVLERLNESARNQFSAVMAAPLINDEGQAKELAGGFIAALAREQHSRTVATLYRAATDGGDGGMEAVQALIEARRRETPPGR